MTNATATDLNVYIHENRENSEPYSRFTKRVQCADGFSISVQASRYTYCAPRDDEGPWYKVECGFPSAHPGDELMAFAEDADRPTETVYGYVPVEIVERLIDAHGGIK